MKILRLLDLREQQEQQARGIFSRYLGDWKRELHCLGNLQNELVQTENLLHVQEEFQISMWQQYANYLAKLEIMIESQKQQVEQKRADVERARLEWEECRREKDKMEVLSERRERAKMEQEKAILQNQLDDIGRTLVLRTKEL